MAVGDIEAVKKNAELKRLKTQVKKNSSPVIHHILSNRMELVACSAGNLYFNEAYSFGTCQNKVSTDQYHAIMLRYRFHVFSIGSNAKVR